MSSSEPITGESIHLEIVALSPTTEITLTDARFVAVPLVANAGAAQVDVAPGMYTVGFRQEGGFLEQTVALMPGTGSFTVREERETSLMQAVAPIPGTATSHEWHVGPAHAVAKKVHGEVSIAARPVVSGLFVFVRDLGEPEVNRAVPSEAVRRHASSESTAQEQRPSVRWRYFDEWEPGNPAIGLTLHDATGAQRADLATLGERDETRHWSGTSLGASAGCWRLRLTREHGLPIEMPVVTSPGWQTQVYLVCRGYGRDRGRRAADLERASVIMTEGDADPALQRDAEDALRALVRLEPLRGPRLDALLRGKLANPIWGIIGAHLLLLRPEPDLDLLDEVLTNLDGLTRRGAQSHPDVQVLRLEWARRRAIEIHVEVRTMPIFRRSWSLLLAMACSQPGLIPAGSFLDRVSPFVLPSRPWLLWSVPAEGLYRGDEAELAPSSKQTRSGSSEPRRAFGLESIGGGADETSPRSATTASGEVLESYSGDAPSVELVDSGWIDATRELLRSRAAVYAATPGLPEFEREVAEILLPELRELDPDEAPSERPRRPRRERPRSWALPELARKLRVPSVTLERTLRALRTRLDGLG